jgi:hypothetical protein
LHSRSSRLRSSSIAGVPNPYLAAPQVVEIATLPASSAVELLTLLGSSRNLRGRLLTLQPHSLSSCCNHNTMDLQSIEHACDVVFSGGRGDAAAFAAANATVMQLGSNTENIPLIQSMFDNSTSSPAILVAAKSLHSLVTEHWTSFTEAQRVEISRLFSACFLSCIGVYVNELQEIIC